MKTKIIFLLVYLGLMQFFNLHIPKVIAQTVDSNLQINYSDVVYGHSDYKTEAILNFITGKKNLPGNIRAELEIRIAYKMLISPQTNVHDISSEEESIYSEELKEIQERLEEILVDRSEVEISKYRNSDQYLNDIIDIYFCYRFFYKDEEKVDRTQVILNYFVNSGVIGKDTTQKLEKNK